MSIFSKAWSYLFAGEDCSQVQIPFCYTYLILCKKFLVAGVITANINVSPRSIRAREKILADQELNVWIRKQLLQILNTEWVEIGKLLDQPEIRTLEEFLCECLNDKVSSARIKITGISINHKRHPIRIIPKSQIPVET